MKQKKIIFVGLLVLMGLNTLHAVEVVEKDNNSNTSNEIDDGYSERKGWSFYFDEKLDVASKKNTRAIKKAEMDLLQKILDENRKQTKESKEQTKIQKKILALLQEQMDPKPKTITVNGKKCVANSSAECFKFPLIAEAKRVPVMANFLRDPYDISKAAKYLQWQAKYFEHAINIGNSLQFAYSQFGEKAYPIGAQSSSYSPGDGTYKARMLPLAQQRIILDMKDKLGYSIFIGKNIAVDIYSALSMVEIIKVYGGMNFEIVFYDQKSKDAFIGAVGSVYVMDRITNWDKIKKTVNPEKFKQFDIFTTPSVVIKLNNKGKKEALTILRGKFSESSFRQKTINFLELKKLIDYKKYSEQNIWKDGSEDFVKKYYKDQMSTDIEGILNQYKKGK